MRFNGFAERSLTVMAVWVALGVWKQEKSTSWRLNLFGGTWRRLRLQSSEDCLYLKPGKHENTCNTLGPLCHIWSKLCKTSSGEEREAGWLLPDGLRDEGKQTNFVTWLGNTLYLAFSALTGGIKTSWIIKFSTAMCRVYENTATCLCKGSGESRKPASAAKVLLIQLFLRLDVD